MVCMPYMGPAIYPAEEKHIEQARVIYATILNCLFKDKARTSIEHNLGVKIDKDPKGYLWDPKHPQLGLGINNECSSLSFGQSTDALKDLKESLEKGEYRDKVEGFEFSKINGIDTLMFLWFWNMKTDKGKPAFEFRINVVGDLGNSPSPHKKGYGIKSIDSLVRAYSDYVGSLRSFIFKEQFYNQIVTIDFKTPLATSLGLYYCLKDLINVGKLRKSINNQLEQIVLQDLSLEEQKVIMPKFLALE